MIDNLQRFYLQRLEVASECALHSNIDDCVNICLELLLKTDLAFWTRALVNLTLADVAPIHDYPDKSRFAAEALRLIVELQEEEHPGKHPFWFVEYAETEKDARNSLARAKLQEEQYQQSLEQEAVVGSMEGPEIEQVAGISSNLNGRDEEDPNIQWVFVGNDNDIPEVEQPLGMEGYFTSNPAIAGNRIVVNKEVLLKQPANAAEAVEVQEEGHEDDGDKLPIRPKTPKA